MAPDCFHLVIMVSIGFRWLPLLLTALRAPASNGFLVTWLQMVSYCFLWQLGWWLQMASYCFKLDCNKLLLIIMAWWLLIAPDHPWWLPITHDGSWSPMRAPDHPRWLLINQDGSRLPMMVPDHQWWLLITHDGFRWLPLAYSCFQRFCGDPNGFNYSHGF